MEKAQAKVRAWAKAAVLEKATASERRKAAVKVSEERLERVWGKQLAPKREPAKQRERSLRLHSPLLPGLK